jgi:WD40 repeat protein/tetratricopeptide (TPR) repeat protein
MGVRPGRGRDDQPTLAGEPEPVAPEFDSERTLADALEGSSLTMPDPSADAEAGPSVDPFARTENASDVTIASGPAPPRSMRRAVPVVPGFEVYGELGRGAMGVVYHARRVLLNRPCALKMVLAGEHASPEIAVRFLAEAESVARLRHPNVVQIYEIGELDGLTYLELEYVEGGSLESRLDGVPWPPREAAALVEPLARAVEEAHRLGIVHRDLKPGNILLAADGTPKLSDFGLAKSLESNTGLTRTESVLGSPSYMAPEQAEGHSREVGPAADVYSLGVILYETLTGRPPFRGATVLQTLELVKSAEPVSPMRLVPGTSRDLETICLKCLQKEPARRYATAGDLADDLRRFLQGDPIHARRSGLLERSWRWARRHPAQASALGIAIVSLLVVTVLSTTFAVLQSQSRQRILALLGESRAQSTKLAVERGITLIDQRDGAGGLLWLARALRNDPSDGAGLHHAIRMNMARAAREQITAPRALLEAHGSGRVVGVAFHPEGRLAVVGRGNGTVETFESGTGQPLAPAFSVTAEKSRLTALAFAADGQRLLVGTARRPQSPSQSQDQESQVTGSVRAWDTAAGRPLGKAVAVPGAPEAFSPDGRLVASVVEDSTLEIRDIATGKLVGKSLVHDRDVSCVAFSPDSRSVLTGTAPADRPNMSRALRWDVATGGLAWSTEPHPGWHIYGVAWSPDGKTIATAANDRHVRLFDAAGGKLVGTPWENPEQVSRVAFSPDGRTVAAGMGLMTGGATERAELRLWDRASGRPLGPDLAHEGGVLDVAFSPDGGSLLSGGSDGTAYLWQLPEGPPVGRPLSGARGDICVTFTPDGRTLFAGGFSDSAVPYDVATGRRAGPALEHGKFVWRIAVSPDGRTVATGGGTPASTNQHRRGFGDARLWDRATGKPLGPPMTHDTDRVREVVFTPDGKALVTIDLKKIRFWDPKDGHSLGADFDLAPEGVAAMALAPDGRSLVVADFKQTLYLWDLVKMRSTVLRAQAHKAGIMRVAISRDGRYVATASWDKTARVWEVSTGAPHGPLLRHEGAIHDVAFSPDGLTVATAGEDEMVRLWDRATGTRIGQPLDLHDGANALTFRPDGRTLAIATLAGTTLWSVPEPAQGGVPVLARWAEAITGRVLDNEGAVTPMDLALWRERRRPSADPAKAQDPVPRPPDADLLRHLALADLAEDQENAFAALWHLDRLIAARPADGSLLVRRVRALGHLGRSAEADRGLDQALERVDDGPTLIELARALLKAGRKEAAARAYTRALEYTEGASELADLADELARDGSWKEAASALARSTAADRSRFDRWYNLALARLVQGDLEGYRAACRGLLAAAGSPVPRGQENTIAWPFALGPAGSADDLATPIKLAEAAVASASRATKPGLLNTLGGVLLRAGRDDEAIRSLEQGIQLGGGRSSPQDWAFLALAYHHIGRADAAKLHADKLAEWRRDTSKPFWENVEIQILRREVETALEKHETVP